MNSFHRRSSRPATPPDPTPERAIIERHGMSRLDSLLVSRGLAPSRTAAQRMIAAGRVSLNGAPLLKPAHELAPDSPLHIEPDVDDRFASRGGLKLGGALAKTGLVVTGKICLDVGQSTGGFTDCLLQAGAQQVIGVDVGHGQLATKLKADPRVIALEGINCRALTAADLGTALPAAGFDLIVGDVSFISMPLILPQLPALLVEHGDLLLLIKPQFEVGAANIGKGGIVRNPACYRELEAKYFEFARNFGLTVRDWFDSPITGGDGNREFFIWLNK